MSQQTTTPHNKGFAIVEVLVITIILAVAAFVGYQMYKTYVEQQEAETASEEADLNNTVNQQRETEQATLSEAPTSIEDEDDLDATIDAIDSADVESDLDTSSLETEVQGY